MNDPFGSPDLRKSTPRTNVRHAILTKGADGHEDRNLPIFLGRAVTVAGTVLITEVVVLIAQTLALLL